MKISIHTLMEEMQPVFLKKCRLEFWESSFLYALFGYFPPLVVRCQELNRRLYF